MRTFKRARAGDINPINIMRLPTMIGIAIPLSGEPSHYLTSITLTKSNPINTLFVYTQSSLHSSLQAAPIAAQSSLQPSHAAPIAAQSSLQAAPIAALLSYPCASVAKPVVRSPEQAASAHHTVTLPLKAPSAGALHLVKVQHVSHNENCVQVPHLALLDWTKYNRIADQLPVPPKPPDVIRHAAHAFRCL